MLNVGQAGDHVYGRLLITWPSLVMSLMVSFCTIPFPTRYPVSHEMSGMRYGTELSQLKVFYLLLNKIESAIFISSM